MNKNLIARITTIKYWEKAEGQQLKHGEAPLAATQDV